MMKWLCVASLGLSMLATVIAINTAVTARRDATRAVRAREQKLIAHLRPEVRSTYKVLRGPKARAMKRPKTIEGLLDPLLQPVRMR